MTEIKSGFEANNVFEFGQKIAHIPRELQDICHLPDGWYFGSGKAPSLDTIDAARKICIRLQQAGAEELEVFPESGGGILIAGYNSDETIEVFCRPDATYDFVFEIDDTDEEKHFGLDERQTQECIGGRSWRKENLSGSFIPGITVPESAATQAWHSKIQVMVVESPLSTMLVPQETANYCVSTSANTIPWQSQATRRFSGASVPIFSRKDTG